MSRQHFQPPSRRQQRVIHELKEALADILRHDLANLDVTAESVTITGIDISPDLRHAHVSVIPLGGDTEAARLLVSELQEYAPMFQRELSKKLYLKYIPRLRFVADTDLDTRWRIEKALHSDKVQRDLKKTD